MVTKMNKKKDKKFQLLKPKTLDFVGYVSEKELKKDWNYKSWCQCHNYLNQGKLYKDKYIVIEDEEDLYKDNEDEISLLYRETSNYLVYVTNKGRVYARDKKKKETRNIKIYTRKNDNSAVFYFGKNDCENYLKTAVWKAFGDSPYERYKHIICHKDGDSMNCDINNLYLMDRSEFMSSLGKESKKDKAKEVGLFEGDRLVKQFASIKEAADTMFVTKQCVSRICNGKVNKGIFDFRFI